MRDATTTAKFHLAGLKGKHTVEVLDENRSLAAEDGVFEDHFPPWQVHLYRLASAERK
jgi:hypothetical protein